MMRLPQNAQYVVSSATKKWQKKTLCAGETERQEKQKLCTQIPSQIMSDLDLNYIRSHVRTLGRLASTRIRFIRCCYVYLFCSDCLFRFLFFAYMQVWRLQITLVLLAFKLNHMYERK